MRDRERGMAAAGDLSSSDVETLLAHYVGRLADGDLLDPDEIRERHADIADTLLAALEVFIDAGTDRNSNDPLGTLGDYTLRREIGRGGMGVVYEAWENSMDRAVALKVLHRLSVIALIAEIRSRRSQHR